MFDNRVENKSSFWTLQKAVDKRSQQKGPLVVLNNIKHFFSEDGVHPAVIDFKIMFEFTFF